MIASSPGPDNQHGGFYAPLHSQEPDYKRCRLGEQSWSGSLAIGAWEIQALAVARHKNASGQAPHLQVSMADMPSSHRGSLWQQQPSAYPSPPHLLEDNTGRLGFPGPPPRRPSSVFSGRTLAGSPGSVQSGTVSAGHASQPTSPTVTSTTSGLNSRSGSISPEDSTPTFEEIHNVPQVSLASRDTERKSILERLPMEIFMRIMLHLDWKEQILLRRCNSNIYDMVRLEAIPWETKTAILLREENFNPRNFPKKSPKAQEGDEPADQDSDAGSCSDNEGTPSSKIRKAKRHQRKDVVKRKPQTRGKSRPDTLDKFACYSCFKILPACYFEGRHPENNTSRAVKSQKKRVHNDQADKKVDTRVGYVQVISVNPSRPPEWLVKDKAEVRATDVETYVTEYMKKGVNCDDLRLHYKDLSSATHCIAPIRGVNPFFTSSSSATPPHCQTYRPVYQVEDSNSSGMDSSAYTYEICIPENSVRDENEVRRPHVAPSTRICQPQQTTVSTPAPQIKEIIALRRFCILCGAKYGAYRRECNRKIISKTEKGWLERRCDDVHGGQQHHSPMHPRQAMPPYKWKLGRLERKRAESSSGSGRMKSARHGWPQMICLPSRQLPAGTAAALAHPTNH
ncbi:hypothetical protein J7T55_002947 [Diaporthe amygdali]|uniref:uncharacterized protein n=1 Tax=Phomopsis amygdali TaxID=1214568 RepID=UPI0022FF39E6|nr:uncharacterized protein J7T55_002947 [Diaporthe amygdali]KAJ0122434.1 hypothetical protein J7T55_002947 [Diaporthe amygdali]